MGLSTPTGANVHWCVYNMHGHIMGEAVSACYLLIVVGLLQAVVVVHRK